MTRLPVRAVIFDKDGTLFDFSATWDVWARGMLRELAAGDAALEQRLARAIDYDLANEAFLPGSIAIAGTTLEAAQALAPLLPGRSLTTIEAQLVASSATAPIREVVPLAPFLAGLAAQDMALGVVTNDAEHSARAHLASAGVLRVFDFVAGFDSGHGAKPDPGPLLAFAERTGTPVEHCLMVGDSTHDLIAGRAAGMRTVGVLTGPAPAEVLRPHADSIIPDIGHLSHALADLAL